MWIDELAGLLKSSGEDSFYRLVYYETCDSTNECVRREALSGAPEGLLIVAEEQTAGKGRSGRSWASPKGEAVYFSFLLRPDLAPERVSALTLVMGLSVAQAVNGLFSGDNALDAGIKWPNDIVVGGKKICGILTEAEARDGRIEWIVVGTGINVNNTAFPADIREKATSLRLALEAQRGLCGRSADGSPCGEAWVSADEPGFISRAAVMAKVLERFHANYGIYLVTGDMEGLIGEYNSLLVSRDRGIRVEDPRGAYTAVSRGIDRFGRLEADREDGTKEMISAGEVSVRGICGYV